MQPTACREELATRMRQLAVGSDDVAAVRERVAADARGNLLAADPLRVCLRSMATVDASLRHRHRKGRCAGRVRLRMLSGVGSFLHPLTKPQDPSA